MNSEKANCYFNTSFWASIVLSIVFFFTITFGKNAFLNSLLLTGQIFQYADDYVSYYRYTLLLYPLLQLFSIMDFFDGDTATCNASNIFMILANIGLSIVFSILYGIKGIGLGTFLGTLGSVIILCTHLFKKTCTFSLKFHFNIKECFTIIRYSIVDAVAYICMGILNYFINLIVVSKFGQEYLAIFAVIYALEELTLVFDGVGDVLTDILGTYRGEENYPAVKSTMHYSAKIAFFEGLIATILCFIFSPVIPKVFSLENEMLYDTCVTAVRFFSITMIFKSISFLISSYYMAIDKVKIGTLLTVIYYLLSPVICIFIFTELFGLTGMWFGYGIEALFGDIIALVLLRIILGKKKFPYILDVYNPGIYNFGLILTEQTVLKLRNDVNKILEENSVETKTINTILVMIEDGFLLIREHNPHKKIAAEFSLFLGDEIKIIFRDNGIIFDMTDSSSRITSLRSYVVSSIMEHQADKVYQITTEYNRNLFTFKK